MIGLRQRQTRPARAQRRQHHRRSLRALELLDHLRPTGRRDATVEERHGAGRPPLEQGQDEVPERAVLREQEDLLARVQDLREDLIEGGELS